MMDAPAPRISLHPHLRRVRVVIDGTLLADTTRANELRERGYPPRQYLPRDNVRMDLLTSSETVTHCPLKGDASYFSFGERKDVAWSYERSLDELKGIAMRVVFYGAECE